MKVAVGIICDAQERLLITQRPLDVPHGGFWEFPGGKLLKDETPEQALVREIREEVGLEVKQYQQLGMIHHHYPDRSVSLFVFKITDYSGSAQCKEGQLGMKWILKRDLNIKDFPEANHKILKLWE